MNRFKQLLIDKDLSAYWKQMDQLEQERIYCRHGLTHALDVARIGYILILEEQKAISKELFYTTALLHDLGRIKQYENGVSHHEAGVKIACEFLEKYGYTVDEIALICDAISSHKHGPDEEAYVLADVLYRADKLSRNCFACQAQDTCYWAQEKRNQTIEF